MTIANPSKAFVAIVALLCITVLRALDKLDQASFNAIAGLLTGYIVGNGVAAKQGIQASAIIAPKSND